MSVSHDIGREGRSRTQPRPAEGSFPPGHNQPGSATRGPRSASNETVWLLSYGALMEPSGLLRRGSISGLREGRRGGTSEPVEIVILANHQHSPRAPDRADQAMNRNPSGGSALLHGVNPQRVALRGTVLAAVLASFALLAAGCGAGSKSPAAATLGATTSGGTTNRRDSSSATRKSPGAVVADCLTSQPEDDPFAVELGGGLLIDHTVTR